MTVQQEKGVNISVPAQEYSSQARIEATVLIILPISERAKMIGGNCAKVPCEARIRIEKVLDSSNAAVFSLRAGQILQVNFQYTVKPSREIWPDAKFGFPGVNQGDRIRANLIGISSHEEIARGNVRFSIREYEVIAP